MSVDLWAVRLERPLTQKETERLVRLLPLERRERLMRQRKEQWAEVLCAYTLLRLALRERFGWQPMPEMVVGELGKPGFPQYPEAHFSVSHTEGAVLVGLSEQPIGVDIERVRPVRERTMREVANTASETEFFRTWVRREARGKRNGIGVAGMMRSEPEFQPGEHYRELEPFPGYLAGAAIGGESPELRLRRRTLEELLAFAECL